MSISLEIQDHPLWSRLAASHTPVAFDLEITARCNNNCRHCYINLPAGDVQATKAELSRDEILDIARQAADMGAVWCLITGGEPLLRDDFSEIYVGLKRMGLLVSVFTNACLVNPEVTDVFKRYPPRDIEISVYGVTRETYENVTRRFGSFDNFTRGLDLLTDSGVRVRLKAVALRSNIHEFEQIDRFCRKLTKDYYRFDPQLHLRIDGDAKRNAEIIAERLSPGEIVELERADEKRFGALQRACDEEMLINPEFEHCDCDHLFHCGAGNNSFTVGYDGMFRLCSSLCHPNTIYDLRTGSVREAWEHWVPHVREMRGRNPEFLERCRKCAIVDLCMWCPAHAALETGAMDGVVEYFCQIAHARAAALGYVGGIVPKASE